MKNKIDILGISFDCLNLDQAVKRIEMMIKNGGSHQVGTMNPEYVVRARTDSDLKKAIVRMALVVPDGIGIILANNILAFKKLLKKRLHFHDDDRWYQNPTLSRIRGGDLVEKLAEFCAQKRYKIALIGGEKGVAKKALLVLKKKYPNLRSFADGGPKLALPHAKEGRSVGRGERVGERSVEQLIKKEKPAVLLTALGFNGPIWIDELLAGLKEKKLSLVALEVGGVFNYLAGRSKLAPKIIQKIGLEWLWRLYWEPWRIKRQHSLLKFLCLVLKS